MPRTQHSTHSVDSLKPSNAKPEISGAHSSLFHMPTSFTPTHRCQGPAQARQSATYAPTMAIATADYLTTRRAGLRADLRPRLVGGVGSGGSGVSSASNTIPWPFSRA
ncbi:hypothetical protein SAMN05660479_00224 [Microbulbifer thermotolerans]|nr:hypothetical protein SAMN05660479_00224 [Microbulbifer thermotolerans]